MARYRKTHNYQKSILVYKCLNGLAPSYLDDLFQSTGMSTNYALRSVLNKNVKIPLPKLEIFKKSFQYSGVEPWNSIPQVMRDSDSLKIFKEKCFSHMFSLM